MKILVVEHDELQRRAIAAALTADGHELIYAHGCSGALVRFFEQMPDLVLMDIALADSDGYQCAQRLRALAGERFAPIVLSTAIDDHHSLRRFLDCGAADFIEMPDNPLVLRAKVNGHAQTCAVHRHLEGMREKFHQEVSFAKHMFDAVLGRSPANLPGLHQWAISAGHFCGDLMIHEKTPDGRLNLMLADFTGHGLAAAVGALPASDAFFAMSRKGLPLGEIVAEINRKLHDLLPTGHFCAATLVSLDLERSRLEAWIGGQPPLLLIDPERDDAVELCSEHFPLGVVGGDRFDPTTCELALTASGYLLLYSDGLLEARNAAGEMFGEERLRQALGERPHTGGLLQRIKGRLVAFLDGLEPHDDVSVLAVDLPMSA